MRTLPFAVPSTGRVIKLRFALASMALLVVVAEESDRIPPVPASFAAKFGLELHHKFGGGKNIALAEAIARSSSSV